MSVFSDDLLVASRRLIARRAGQTGPIKSAYVRRSISTTYYAIFHFCLDEAATRLVGTSNELRQSRRAYIRSFSHTGLTKAFRKLNGAIINNSVDDLFRFAHTPAGPVATPAFVQQLAIAYVDAKVKREDADYNLNEPLSATDARLIYRRVRRAISNWENATTSDDRKFKHAVALLLSIKGQVRSDQ